MSCPRCGGKRFPGKVDAVRPIGVALGGVTARTGYQQYLARSILGIREQDDSQ
jgi:hypothetical protein